MDNFESLLPSPLFDDVIKIQLLFQEIKGAEKDNRNILNHQKAPVAPQLQQCIKTW